VFLTVVTRHITLLKFPGLSITLYLSLFAVAISGSTFYS
jgi:hypothetical protein